MNTLRDAYRRGLAQDRRSQGKPPCDHAGARCTCERPLFKVFICDRCGEGFTEWRREEFPPDPPVAS